MKKYFHPIVFCLPFLIACGKSPDVFNLVPDLDSMSSIETLPVENENSEDATPLSPSPVGGLQNFKPKICSDLNFENISWPMNTNQETATLFALAMNISGSFEGHEGWENISNNFDGQGLSLGLFNQNLGQGSLQPLLLRLRSNSKNIFDKFFTKTQLTSLNAMLNQWNGNPTNSVLSKGLPALDFYKNKISPLDDPSMLDEIETLPSQQKVLSSKNQKSVDWAINTIYNGSKFKPEWKIAFQKLASSPEYISLQVEAAKYIHNKSVNYMNTFKFKETRAYLFFFDIVVQNGSLTSGVENKYRTWVKSNANASELNKLKQFLEYRLALVRPQYVNDVRLRKTAVIVGTGTVHGTKRDFRKEYCGPSWSTTYSGNTNLK